MNKTIGGTNSLVGGGRSGARPASPRVRSRTGWLYGLPLAVALGLAFAGSPVATGVAPADSAAEQLNGTRTVLEKWVETRRIISKERRDWAQNRELLTDRMTIVQREIDSLRAKIADIEGSITEADTKRAELVAENERLEEASAALESMVTGFEQRTRGLLARLPGPIRELVKPLSQSIPDDPNDTKLSLSERFQNVIGILNEINKFNGQISVTSELRELPDGSSAEVTAMYIGIGQGYYVGGNGTIAGVGSATADGWVWTPANDAAGSIAEAIAILKGEQVAHFVKLPVRID
ncbi:MAG: DUF3450 family protein [Phycisphaerales bacterium]|nr:DUF3450 family protein [Phycisphaerales bacterium]